MKPDYVHVPTEYGVRSVYVPFLEDGEYELEIDGSTVRLVKRGSKVVVDADEYYIQQGPEFWWFDGEELIKIDVSSVDANYSTAFMSPSLLMAYAELWPSVSIVLITTGGRVKKLAFGDDTREFGIRYRAGGKEGVLSPVVEDRGEYKKVCLTCIREFLAGIVIDKDTRSVDVITHHGILSYGFGRFGNGVIVLPEVGCINLLQYV